MHRHCLGSEYLRSAGKLERQVGSEATAFTPRRNRSRVSATAAALTAAAAAAGGKCPWVCVPGTSCLSCCFGRSCSLPSGTTADTVVSSSPASAASAKTGPLARRAPAAAEGRGAAAAAKSASATAQSAATAAEAGRSFGSSCTCKSAVAPRA